MQKTLSVAWLVLGLALATITIMDLSSPYWQISWLVVGGLATVLALWTAASMFFGLKTRAIVSMTTALCFSLYWIYLFLIEPPTTLNLYAVEGLLTLILAVATALSFFSGRRPTADTLTE
jgi:hypothetical protein